MNVISLSRLAVASLLVASVKAQTFVVDVNNGPGTDFTSLVTAMATVPDGATLVVRAGVYPSSTTSPAAATGKGMTILGEPGAMTFGVWISGQAANQRVVVKGMQFGGSIVGGLVSLHSCQGPVHIEDCGPFANSLVGLQVVNCAQVSVVRGSFPSSTYLFSHFQQSNVACTQTEFMTPLSNQTALSLSGGTTQLTKCSIQGGPPYAHNPIAGIGIAMNGGELRLLGPGLVAQGGSGGAAISGTGTVRKTATVNLVGPTIPFVTIDEASTSTTGASLGGSVIGRLEGGSAALLGGLMLGFPFYPPVVVPGVGGDLWVNPLGFMTLGVLGGPPLAYTAFIPNDPTFRGLQFGWQGMTWDPIAEFVLSNPAWFCVQ